ncbi:MAG: sialidase family protein, partial [Bacteroidota bacterium]
MLRTTACGLLRERESAATSTWMSSQFTDVFVSGTEGYHTYRIPSMVRTQGGILLAFTEARSAQKDHAQNDLVLKRSQDQGANCDEYLDVVPV